MEGGRQRMEDKKDEEDENKSDVVTRWPLACVPTCLRDAPPTHRTRVVTSHRIVFSEKEAPR
jgi:hypothetical protein